MNFSVAGPCNINVLLCAEASERLTQQRSVSSVAIEAGEGNDGTELSAAAATAATAVAHSS
jgi:hypothetical protein